MTVVGRRTERPASGPAGRRRSSAATVAGTLLLILGVVGLGWFGYQYVGTNVVAQRTFEEEKAGLRERWSTQPEATKSSPPTSKPSPIDLGEAMGLLRVPAFGKDFEVPILAGTDLDTLSRGVGHYTSTAAPGQIGNFAIAGHRVTHGQPFAKLLDLDRGDKVSIETRSAIYTYVLDRAPRELTVDDTETWVLEPVPGRDAAPARRALLTLTTCQDLFRSSDRSVGFGHLIQTTHKGG